MTETLLKNASVFLPDGTFRRTDVRFAERITALGNIPSEDGTDASGCYLIPGMLDIHTHGAVGADFSDGDAAALPALFRHYARHGVTGVLATTMTLPEETLTRAVRTVSAFSREADCARCLGVYLEGPFLSGEKCGAQRRDCLVPPSVQMLERIDAACGDRVRVVAVAPELHGALPFIREASRRCVVTAAHTNADYDTARAAFGAGVTQLTHIFNGMPELLHRAPGVVGAGMDCGAFAELICDGVHNHASVVRAAFRMFPDRIVLISDSVRAAGMPDGMYTLGGLSFTLSNGKATLPDGTLAGSSITLLDALRNAVSFGIPLEQAVAAATVQPARAVRLSDAFGSIQTGRLADLVLLGHDLSLRAVFIGGTPVPLGGR